MLAEPGGLVQRRRPAGVVRLQPVEFVEECLVGAGLLVRGGDLLDHGHQGLGDEPAPVHTEMTTGSRDRGRVGSAIAALERGSSGRGKIGLPS